MSAWLAPGSTSSTVGSPGHAHEQEDGQRQQKQREQRVAEPPEDVTRHAVLTVCLLYLPVSVTSS